MARLHIVADANIPLVEELFRAYAEVRRLPAHEIGRAELSRADVLLVRSPTRVDENLLHGTPVKFVGSATSGIDHVDVEYLERQKIGFAFAPGSNANSVAEYVVAALFSLAEKYHFTLCGKTIGIVGVGHVGTGVAAKSRALDMRVLLNDPPRARVENSEEFLALDALLAECDILTVHTPLTRTGPDATLHLFDDNVFARMHPGTIFLNTARGAVVQTAALKNALGQGRVELAVLDVWEDEPCIDVELLNDVHLATPHIAGYSLDGKIRATQMLYARVCSFFGHEVKETVPPLTAPDHSAGMLDYEQDKSVESNIAAFVRRCYDIAADDRRLRKMAGLPKDRRGAYFRSLRQSYPERREFFHKTIRNVPNQETRSVLQALGFKTS